MIQTYKYIMFTIIFGLFAFLLYTNKNLSIKKIIIYSLVFSIFLKITDSYLINNVSYSNMEKFQSEINMNINNNKPKDKEEIIEEKIVEVIYKDLKKDNKKNNYNFSKPSLYEYTMERNDNIIYSDSENKNEEKNNNGNILFVKKSQQRPKDLSTQQLNKKKKEKKEINKNLEIEIEKIKKKILKNRYNFYKKKSKMNHSDFIKNKEKLNTKLQLLYKMKKSTNNDIEKNEQNNKYINISKTNNKNLNKNDNNIDIVKIVNNISKKKTVSKLFNSLKKNNDTDHYQNSKENFTNYQRCENVKFKKYNEKYCFIIDNDINCFKEKFIFGINQDLDSAFASIINYLNTQKNPLKCLKKKSIINNLKKWNLFSFDENGYYLERYKRMFSILISSGESSKFVMKKLKFQLEIIDRMIQIRYQINYQDSLIESDDDSEKDTLEQQYENRENLYNRNSNFNNNIDGLQNSGINNHSYIKKKTKELDNTTFNRVLSAPNYYNRFERKNCKECKKCPELPNMNEYIKKSKIPCWGCNL